MSTINCAQGIFLTILSFRIVSSIGRLPIWKKYFSEC